MPTDFWGLFWVTILPNYIAAFGGLAATLLAIYSLWVSAKARTEATSAIAADADTRERAADLFATLSPPLLTGDVSPLLTGDDTWLSETLDSPIPDEQTSEEYAKALSASGMDRARFEHLLELLRKSPPRA